MAKAPKSEPKSAPGNDPKSDAINRQYERWIYPEPITDLPAWLTTRWQWCDPSHGQPIFFPDRDYWPGMDILVAGCGTNQAATIAYTNPQAKVFAVDISQASLDHEAFLKDKYQLDNLELHRIPIEDLPTLGREFDLVVSTGVLMVMADPQEGMNALAKCVRPDGAIAIMVYAKYGRFAVTLLQSVFRDMGLGQDEESIHLVRTALTMLTQDHPIRSYLNIADDLDYDAGLVDTFLISRELTYSAQECVDLVEKAGLVFQTWLLNAPYHPHTYFAPNEFNLAVEALPKAMQWSVMDRLRAVNGCHFFVATRTERPARSYAIDFSTPESLDYVPVFRQRCGLDGNEMYRPSWRYTITPDDAALVRLVDGSRSIRDIAALTRESGAEDHARRLIEALWRLDFVAATFRAR